MEKKSDFNPETGLEIDRLSKRYNNGVLAINMLTLQVKPGEIFCMLGANGAGKTSTLMNILGFTDPTEGTIKICGIDVNKSPLEAKKHVAYVSENVQLYGNFNAIQHLSIFCSLAGHGDLTTEVFEKTLLRVGLARGAHRRQVKGYSKGMRQRLGIAIAILKNAEVILLDEPTSGLDPTGGREFLRLLDELRDEGKAIIMTTHDIFRAKEIANRVGIMAKGNLLRVLSRSELDREDLEKLYIEYVSKDISALIGLGEGQTADNGRPAIDDKRISFESLGTISGKVTLVDKQPGEYVGVKVGIEGTNLWARTDRDGAFTLLWIPPGTFNITAFKGGYTSVTLPGAVIHPRGNTVLPPVTLHPMNSAISDRGWVHDLTKQEEVEKEVEELLAQEGAVTREIKPPSAPSEQGEPILRIANLVKIYDNSVLAVDHLNLDVYLKEIFCMLGANGAGKTTTINMILGFTNISGGTIAIAGVDVAKFPLKAKQHVAYVSENVMLYPNFSATQNLRFFTELVRKDRITDLEYTAVLDRVGLAREAHKRRTGSFSKGMRQRLGIAIGIMQNAELILLDEPTSGLDPKGGREFLQLLAELRKEGKAILMTTHDIFRAQEIADRVGIMAGGNLVEHLTREQIEKADLEELYTTYITQNLTHGKSLKSQATEEV